LGEIDQHNKRVFGHKTRKRAGLLELLKRTSGEAQGVALTRKGKRDGSSDATARSGDQSDPLLSLCFRHRRIQ